jgi:hypothetical protein
MHPRNRHVGDYSREASGNRIGTATWAYITPHLFLSPTACRPHSVGGLPTTRPSETSSNRASGELRGSATPKDAAPHTLCFAHDSEVKRPWWTLLCAPIVRHSPISVKDRNGRIPRV